MRPDGAIAYVTSEADGQVYAIDTKALRVAAKIPVGPRPRSIVFSADGKRAYVSSENGAEVAILDAQAHTRLRSVKLTSPGARPMGLALAHGLLFVGTGRGGALELIDLATERVRRTVTGIGARPWGVAAYGDRVFTANGPSNDVSVIDASTGRILDRVRAGRSPWGVAITR
jgi:YVTN family beta-propeller protein